MEQNRTVDSISQKPNNTRIVRSWTVPPGLTFSLLEDQAQQLWVVESCPVGSHYWTLDQVAELPLGMRTRHVIQEVLREARKLQQKAANPSSSRSVRRALSPREVPTNSRMEPKAEPMPRINKHRSEQKAPSAMAMNLLIAK